MAALGDGNAGGKGASKGQAATAAPGRSLSFKEIKASVKKKEGETRKAFRQRVLLGYKQNRESAKGEGPSREVRVKA